MHVVCINYTFENSLTSPAALLDRYETLVGWANALTANGARVSVVQRFSADAEFIRNGVLYHFVRNPAVRHGSVLDRPERLHRVVLHLKPDIVHVNGLHFGRQAAQLKELFPSVPILLQDHANLPPKHWLNRWTLRKAMRRMDAVSFVSQDQARPWLDGRFIHEKQPVVELMEGSSGFQLKSRAESRAISGLSGDPVCLWVGRLNANKDPLTVLRGFAKALPAIPNARLAMVYHTADLLPSIHQWMHENPFAAARMSLLGHQTRAALEDLYNSADLFVLGSHREGSGFAVLEALACGVTPILTDIPSFRVLTGHGSIGKLWQVGDADALSRTLQITCSGLRVAPEHARAFFAANFSWNAIGRRAIDVYRSLLKHDP